MRSKASVCMCVGVRIVEAHRWAPARQSNLIQLSLELQLDI